MAGRRRPQKQTIVVRREIPVPVRNFPHDEGEFTVAAGTHEIMVQTFDKTRKLKKGEEAEPMSPVDVWVSLEDDELQVCGGDISRAGVSLMPDGFVIYLEVKAVECLVKWYAEL